MSDASQRYSSKDFAATKATFAAEVPDRLIHRAVGAGTGHEGFSAERRHGVWIVDLPSRVISMTLGELEGGQSSRRHRHTYETLLYILEGEGSTHVDDVSIDWVAGDAIYVPVMAWHSHENRSPTRKCRYLACENAPMLQNLGVALREEG